jgi:hypothetical protein
MKKLTLTIVLVVSIFVLFADLMQPTDTKRAIETKGKDKNREEGSYRNIPFLVEPISLITNYYDYMPGSYNGLPVRVQPLNPPEPGTWEGGGVYMAYHAQETPTATRRAYYSYIDASGNVITQGTPINSTIIGEGYIGIDIDPLTGDPMAAWHSNVSGNEPPPPHLEIMFTYDLYDWIGGPGLWVNPPWEIMNDSEPYNPHPDDDNFAWPYVLIGDSPNDGYRRVFVVANNGAVSTGPNENPSENSLVAYADYNTTELGVQSGLDWTHYSIPQMDAWHDEEPEWYRPFKAVTISDDGQYVAFMGYRVNDSSEQLPDDEIFVLLNDNYGEGDYTYYGMNFNLGVENPGSFDDDDGNGYNLNFSFVNSGHFNAIFTENDSKILFNGALGLNGTSINDETDNVYWPYAIYPKVFEFDLETHEFHFYNLDTQINENAVNQDYIWAKDYVYLPWDTDNDGINDEIGDEGEILWISGWPCYYSGTDFAFHENNFKIVKNEETGWVAAVWQDGLAAKYAEDGVEGYEDWLEMPEIAVATFQTGENHLWTETEFVNANPNSEDYATELNNMTPAYTYPGDFVEDLGDEHGKMHLMFLDDNSWGSGIHDCGDTNGGTMMYTALELDFSNPAYENYGIVRCNIADIETQSPIVDAVIQMGTYRMSSSINDVYEIYLPAGSYPLTCEIEGYDVYEHTGEVNVTTGQVTELDIELFTGIGPEGIDVPITLSQNHPNPFNPETTISFDIPREDANDGEIGIYNLKGQKVKSFSAESYPEFVEGSVIWSGTDEVGKAVSSGIYFYKLELKGKTVKTKKMILMK